MVPTTQQENKWGNRRIHGARKGRAARARIHPFISISYLEAKECQQHLKQLNAKPAMGTTCTEAAFKNKGNQ